MNINDNYKTTTTRKVIVLAKHRRYILVAIWGI